MVLFTVTVYVCVQGSENVITDVIIQNEKDVPPPGYTLIERTLDSSLCLSDLLLQHFNHLIIIIIIIIHALIRVTLSQKYATGALYKVNDAFTVTVQMLAFMSGHHQRMP